MYKTFTYFDGLGRPIQSQNRGAAIHGLSEWRDIVTLTSYNAQGVSHCTTAPFSKTHVPDSHVPAFYTALPCTSPSLDPTLTSYDNLARPLTITTPGGAVTSYSYATAPTSGVYHLASYCYDTDSSIIYPRGLGQLVETTWGSDPTNHKDLFNYDPLGRVSSQTRTLANRSYALTTLTWDILNRPLTLRTPHNNETITLSYDHEGENSLAAGSDTLVSNITYNQWGQMVSLVRGSFTSSYSYYTGSGNSGTGNNDFRQSYDLENRLTQVTADTNSSVTRFSYDSQGQRTISEVETPGVSKTVTYYPFPTYQEEVRYQWW
ncbi:MAG: hypothetical protein KJ063_03430 [Anaerolineae bacterium]|nr:hypothetical protein [Anaerolineae bacterium]